MEFALYGVDKSTVHFLRGHRVNQMGFLGSAMAKVFQGSSNLIGAVSNNSFLAAILGSGQMRAARLQVTNQQDAIQPIGSSTTATDEAVDTVEFSKAGLNLQSKVSATAEIPQLRATDTENQAIKDSAQQTIGRSKTVAVEGTQSTNSSPLSDGQGLTPEEEKQVKELKLRDQEVRRHEQAHKAAAGTHATGGASFEYTTGPDGKRYVSGGEVQIDTSPVSGNPRATVAKMQQIRRAALSPAEPSGQDRAVAAQAAAAEQQARAEMVKENQGEVETGSSKIDTAQLAGTVSSTVGEKVITNTNRPRSAGIATTNNSSANIAKLFDLVVPSGKQLDVTA